MGIMDVFGKEERVSVTYSDFYALMKESAKAELLMNGISTGVCHEAMYAMMTGKVLTPVTCACEDCGEDTEQEDVQDDTHAGEQED